MMAQTIGRVVETPNNEWALVVAEKDQGCASCGAVTHCHGGRPAPVRQTSALNPIGAEVGDRVLLTVESGKLLSRLALLYLLPVAMMLIGAFWGVTVSSSGGMASNGQSIGYGLTGFIFGFGMSVAISRIWFKARPVVPIISRIIDHHFQPNAFKAGSGCGCQGR
ncbi:positive regulator of sigma E, RseC/MucC [Desulfosarcina variabilis str. Montpellier]|uniref:SoxR reducing system RseC family protein n=1 Tax=Desulfosarcina variabilis TaxID=2300 RepID=UPI003AFA14A3